MQFYSPVLINYIVHLYFRRKKERWSLLTERKVGGFHDLRADSEEAELESHADHVVPRYIRQGELLLGMEPGRAQKGDAESREGGEAAHDAASGQRDTTWTTRAAHLRFPNSADSGWHLLNRRITCESTRRGRFDSPPRPAFPWFFLSWSLRRNKLV